MSKSMDKTTKTSCRKSPVWPLIRRKPAVFKRRLAIVVFGLLLISATGFFPLLQSGLLPDLLNIQTAIAAAPPGVTTAPYKVTYTAKLTSAGGVPVTTSQSVRFSLWTDADWDAGDVDGLGNINPLAPGYAGWQETHTVTPNVDGIFTVELGSINTFPNFTLATHTYLQVEVKPSASPLTAFEVLDPDGNTANLTDRKPYNSAPYAINADTVDNRDASNTPNNIPVLDAFGKLVYGVLPDAVQADTFILDVNDDAPGNNITLQFGSAIAEFLRWNNAASTFELSDSLDINGDLTFSGTGNITGATIDGTLNTLQNIPISALTPYAKQIRLSPEYDGAALKADGTANNGIMALTNEDLGPPLQKYNYYIWTTNKAAAQDLDIKVRYQLPTDFVAFTAAPISLTYQTADAVPANNSVDLTLTDSAGAAAPLTGAGGLASATWTTAAVTFAGAPTFTPGSWIEFSIKMTSTSGKFAKVGDLVLNYTGR
jgi:hypothetical protein